MATAALEDDDDQVRINLRPPAGDGDAASGSSSANGDIAAASVTFRRTKGRDSLKRLSDILSAYMPVRGGVGQQHQQHLQQPLLECPQEDESSEAAAGSPPVSPGIGYRTLMLLDVASLRLGEFPSREDLPAAEDADAGPQFADSDISGVALSKSGFAFLTFKDSASILRLEVQPRQPDTPVSKTCRTLQVKLAGGVALVPTDIKVHKERLFVCGRVRRLVDEQLVSLSVMARCDLDCQVEQASKELPGPRFLGFDIDPVDDQPVVASPTPDGRAAQIFKMSPDFRRKLFKIQLGSASRDSCHLPEFVACLGPGNRCWVAAEQADSVAGLAGSQVKHRLLSFPLRPPPAHAEQEQQQQQQQQQQSTKAWMKVSSWKFEGIQPGRLLATPGDTEKEQRLLMLSRDQGNIYCISEELGCSVLTHPAAHGGQAFTSFCCLQEPSRQQGTVDILATTRDSLFLLQAS